MSSSLRFYKNPVKPCAALAQGTTPQLSKVWMPLKDYIGKTMEGLRLGKYQIAVGGAADAYDRFERVKMDAVYQNSGIKIHE